MTPIKINNSNIINVSLFFFPLAFILGNSMANINFVIFTILGLYYVFQNKINIPFDNLTKIIFCLFLIIILSSILNLINNYHNINHPDITINDYWESLKKSLIFFRYFIFTLVFVALSNYGLINFKYILSSILFFSLCLSFDIIIQSTFGSNMLGFKQIADGVNSGFFGKELVAGGYLQRLSIPALFFLYYLFRNNKNYNSFIFVAGISLIGIGIILASNRMPLLSFLLGMSLFFLACKNLRKNILVGMLIVLLSFIFIFKNHNYTNQKFHSFAGAIERIVKYTGITIS